MNIYLSAILIAITATSAHAQLLQPVPKLVVNITIEQLRTDYLESFTPLYTNGGMKKMIQQGRVYEETSYSFSPVDHASAIASIVTGTTPYYNSIVGVQWLDKNTLRPIFCVDDSKYQTSPANISTSTITDEMKVSSKGAAIIYAIAPLRESAVLAAGHAGDGAFWIDDKTGTFTTSSYYSLKVQNWIKNYNKITQQPANSESAKNAAVIKAAEACISGNLMGKDDVTDMMSISLSAKCKDATNWQTEVESTYLQLDNLLADFITNIENSVGKNNVLFVLTSTGYQDEQNVDYHEYRIPTGTFYINRTANLLNIYLGAIYGQGRYVDACFHNEIYFNHKLIEQKRISFSDILSRSQEFLIQNAGVQDVFTSERLLAGGNDVQKIRNGYNPSISGDIRVEIVPGWQLLNEDNQENYTSRSCIVPFPIIIYGAGIKPQHIATPVTVERIAPTIARTIHIRAPNACKADPLP
jgi:hypothetical protein